MCQTSLIALHAIDHSICYTQASWTLQAAMLTSESELNFEPLLAMWALLLEELSSLLWSSSNFGRIYATIPQVLLSSLWGRNVSTFILLRVFRLIRMSCWTGKNVADMVQYDVLHRSWHRFVGVCCGVYFRYVRPFKRGIAVLQCSQPAATFGESVLSHNCFRKKPVDTKNFALN